MKQAIIKGGIFFTLSLFAGSFMGYAEEREDESTAEAGEEVYWTCEDQIKISPETMENLKADKLFLVKTDYSEEGEEYFTFMPFLVVDHGAENTKATVSWETLHPINPQDVESMKVAVPSQTLEFIDPREMGNRKPTVFWQTLEFINPQEAENMRTAISWEALNPINAQEVENTEEWPCLSL